MLDTPKNYRRLMLCGFVLLAACSEPPPPPSVQEFLDNSIKLESTMVRCSHDRLETRYDAECVNARQAVSLIEAREERARRKALELQSERKRAALRRTQEASAEARRRAADAERRRKEAEYLAQFGELPPPESDDVEEPGAANAPVAVLPEVEEPEPSTVIFDDTPAALDGGNAPVIESGQSANSLDAVRDELRRRNEEPAN